VFFLAGANKGLGLVDVLVSLFPDTRDPICDTSAFSQSRAIFRNATISSRYAAPRLQGGGGCRSTVSLTPLENAHDRRALIRPSRRQEYGQRDSLSSRRLNLLHRRAVRRAFRPAAARS
jgi:hypothetical protein